MARQDSYEIDHAARRQLAEAIRHFASGRLTNEEFEERIPNSKEKALRDIEFLGIWPYYDDVRTHKFVGSWALNGGSKAFMARVILFLRSGQPYKFPIHTRLNTSDAWLLLPVIGGWLLGSLSIGFALFILLFLMKSSCESRWHRRRIRPDAELWPFRSQEDYQAALARPVCLTGASTRS